MNKKEFARDIIIVVLTLAVGGLIYTGWSKGKFNFFGSENESLPPVQENQDETEGWKTYGNEKYGFELTFNNNEYRGYNTERGYNVKEEKRADGSGVIISFNVDSFGTSWLDSEFSVFYISVYPVDWWNKSADIKNNKEVFIKGQEEIPPYFLGKFLGKNTEHAFTWNRGQDCPGDLNYKSETTFQCRLFEDAPNVLKTFKFTK